jgi:endonuclease/exonuclease/phosphatase family metal-dependent hydrolase
MGGGMPGIDAGWIRPRRLSVGALALALVATLALPLAAEAKPKKSINVKVMTRNLFLGADLGPAINADGIGEFLTANGGILREVDETDFPRRSRLLADEIKEKKPDLVGLQEVALWRTADPCVTPSLTETPTATEVVYDFLELLKDRINRNKKLYKVAVVQKEFDFEAPADKNQQAGDGPPAGDLESCNPGGVINNAELNGRLTMRDVILVRKPQKGDKTKVKVKNPTGGNFDNLLIVRVANAVDVDVTRGWTAVDAVAKKGKGKNKVKKKFRFINTHFEAFDDETEIPSIRSLQAQEMAGIALDPAYGGERPVILLGDFNSDVRTKVQPGDAQAYQALLDAGFTERSTHDPLSCCVSDLFTSPPSEFDHQVDHVMTDASKKKIKLVKSSVVGRKRIDGIYPSDHAGVFSKLRLK